VKARGKRNECSSCGEECATSMECPHSKRPCGHHCNHSWSHDHCCWCGEEFGDGEEAADAQEAS